MMKALTFRVLCLALFSAVSCQYLMSSAVLGEREDILEEGMTWVLEMDEDYYEIYEDAQTTFTKTFLPITSLRTDLYKAYNALHLSLGDSMPGDLSSLSEFLSTLFDSYSLNSFNNPMFSMVTPGMQGSFVATARGLQESLHFQLSEILTYVMSPEPAAISDSCAVKILKKFPSIYESIVDEIHQLTKDIKALMPAVRTQVSISVKKPKADLELLTSKIKDCNKITSTAGKLSCAQAIGTFYNGNNGALNLLAQNMQAPLEEFNMKFAPILQMYPTEWSIYETDLFHEKIGNLKLLC